MSPSGTRRRPAPASAPPLLPLTTYQQRWLQDDARLKCARWARQTGKTFAATLEIAQRVVARREQWLIVSAGERQALEAIEQCARHCRALGLAVEVLTAQRVLAGAEYRRLEIRLPTGARVLALPANPATIRGYTAHVYLDEYAMHEDGDAIWAAVFPAITRGGRLLITSTPRGPHNKFAELCRHPGIAQHVVTIEDAVAGGLVLRDERGQPITPATLRALLADELAWQQEYLVQFIDAATTYFPAALLAAAEDAQATTVPPPDWQPQGPLYIGVDVGRVHDLTVVWVLEAVDETLWTRAVLEWRQEPYRTQWAQLRPWLARAERAAIDATGLGHALAEEAAAHYPTVEAVTLTAARKEALSLAVRRALEEGRLRLPASRAIVDDFAALRRLVGPTGTVRLDATRTAEGHADRYWACALAVGAASGPTVQPAIRSLWPVAVGEG